MHPMITQTQLQDYCHYLQEAERSPGTIQKNNRNLQNLLRFLAGNNTIDKEAVMDWKQHLTGSYAAGTVNSMLAAANGLFQFLGWSDCRVKPLRLQRQIFRNEAQELSKPEYRRLLEAARSHGNQRLFCLIQTLAATGIRISELPFVTVESLQTGRTMVDCKGKQRLIFLPAKLRSLLQSYCSSRQMTAGPIFVTRSGAPMDRSNVWRELHRLCQLANVEPSKVFPHNFRHLFAKTFYSLDKDMAKLADLLGHASIETTRIYIMESGTEHQRLMEQLDLVI